LIVPSSAVKCACCETAGDGPLSGGAKPATFSRKIEVRRPAAFTVESVNFGNASYMTAPKINAAPSSAMITLRYVTVFQAT